MDARLGQFQNRFQKKTGGNRKLRISRTAKKSNEKALREADSSRALIKRTHKRQATFFGLEMRKEKLEHLLTTVNIDGKHRRGTQREYIVN